jgi:phenylalanyl-tRNA synthetase beta chain
MILSYNWLKTYLPTLDLSPADLSVLLTDIGLEVEEMETRQSVKGGLEGLVVGEVVTCSKHPNADKLSLTTVNIGSETLSIVCGAPNVAAGQHVIIATIGTTLYPTEGEPFKIKKGKIRGEESNGMICAQDEIGLGKDHSGIIVLPNNTPIGTPAAVALQIQSDTLFHLGITPNRSDANCYMGVAKDIYAALLINYNYSGVLVLPSVDAFKPQNQHLPIQVTVEDTDRCTRYSGISIQGIKVAPSPQWLQDKLTAVGERPINNIVDITNFILKDLGQPLHAFDADKIANKHVVVATLPQDTPFVTLEDKEIKLNAEDLMICDHNRTPMCMGGIFGGLDSGVTDATVNIFLEAAHFDMRAIRRSSQRHGLKTNAAKLFERGSDPNNTLYALKRAALLIQELAGGTIASEVIDIYPKPKEKPQVVVTFSHLKRLLGVELAPSLVKQILAALEMDIIAQTPDSLTVEVPTNKVDVLREVDVIEEIVRIYGLNKIPIPNEMSSVVVYSERVDAEKIQDAVGNFLAANGCNEMMGLSIQNPKHYPDNANLVHLLSSINADLTVMRKNLLFTSLEAVLHNQNHRNSDLRLFEFGKSYRVDANDAGEQTYTEKTHLTITLTGNKLTESWRTTKGGVKHHFFDLKELVDLLLAKLNLRPTAIEYIAQHEHLSYGLLYKNKKKALVTMGVLKKSLTKANDIKQEVFYAEFDWDAIIEQLRKQADVRYTEISKYPAVRRDLALLLDKNVTFGQISDIALKTVKGLLQSVNLFDIFADESKIGEGKKSYAVSFVLQDTQKTLTNHEIEQTMQKLQQQLEKELNAVIR